MDLYDALPYHTLASPFFLVAHALAGVVGINEHDTHRLEDEWLSMDFMTPYRTILCRHLFSRRTCTRRRGWKKVHHQPHTRAGEVPGH